MNMQFVNRIEIQLESLGIGDVLARTPLIEALRKTHSTAEIEVTTTHPEIFIDNPHLTRLYKTKRDYMQTYDSRFAPKPNYASYQLIAEETAELCGVKLDDYRPQLFLSRLEMEEAAKLIQSWKGDAEIIIGVQLQNNRLDWHGKSYPPERAAELITRLRETGAIVVEFGKGITSTGCADIDLVDKTEFRELAATMANLDLTVCVDSLASHICRWASIPQFTLYGATHPVAYCLDWTIEYPIFREDLACVGCYQHKGVNDLNKCALGFAECMEGLSVDEIMNVITMSREDLLARNIKLLQKYREQGL